MRKLGVKEWFIKSSDGYVELLWPSGYELRLSRVLILVKVIGG